MDINSLPLMAALKKRMAWLNQNQAVLSENVSNADTTGYKAKQLAKQDFSQLVDNLSGGDQAKPSMKMRTNHERHITADGGVTGKNFSVEKNDEGEESLVGNNVVLEEEMLKVADNQMQYGMVVNLYKKNVGLLKTALGKRQ